jgi:hypothetical protein
LYLSYKSYFLFPKLLIFKWNFCKRRKEKGLIFNILFVLLPACKKNYLVAHSAMPTALCQGVSVSPKEYSFYSAFNFHSRQPDMRKDATTRPLVAEIFSDCRRI